MERFLSGGEPLLTSLMVYEKLDERMMLGHLEKLNKKQVSGFVVRRQNIVHWNQLFDVLLHFIKYHTVFVYRKEYSVNANIWNGYSYIRWRMEQMIREQVPKNAVVKDAGKAGKR